MVLVVFICYQIVTGCLFNECFEHWILLFESISRDIVHWCIYETSQCTLMIFSRQIVNFSSVHRISTFLHCHFFFWRRLQDSIHGVTGVVQYLACGARCRGLPLKVLLVHLLLHLKVLVHDVVEGLLESSHLLWEVVSVLLSGRVLILWNVEVAWHCDVVFEDARRWDRVWIEGITVHIELIDFSFDDVVPFICIEQAISSGVLIMQVLKSWNLPLCCSFLPLYFLYLLRLNLKNVTCRRSHYKLAWLVFVADPGG